MPRDASESPRDHPELMKLRQIAKVHFPTRWAAFRLLAFEGGHPETEMQLRQPETALALMLGDIHNSPPIVRIHSQCMTGDVFHSLRCDCRDQLHLRSEERRVGKECRSRGSP